MMKLASVLAMFLLATAGSALAQLSSEGGPIQIEAGKAEILDQSKRVVYSSNVDVVQGDARLQSDVLTINFEGTESQGSGGIGGGFGAIDNMNAVGNVHYVTQDLKARGDNATYTAATDTVFMTGNVILARGEDIAQGECLTLEIGAGKSTLGCGENGPGNERVIIQINPAERASSGRNE